MSTSNVKNNCPCDATCSPPDATCDCNVEATPSRDCRHGMECSRSNCKFNHPEGWVATPSACRNGSDCKNRKCSFKHPVRSNSNTGKDCRFGNECKNSKCGYKHPEGWDSRNTKPCKFGVGCTKQETCMFQH